LHVVLEIILALSYKVINTVGVEIDRGS